MKLIYLQTLTWCTVLGAVLGALWLAANNRAARDEMALGWPLQVSDAPAAPAFSGGGVSRLPMGSAGSAHTSP